MRVQYLVLVIAVLSAAAFGQTTGQPRFEVASVKVAAPADYHMVAWQRDFGGKPGRVLYSDVTLQELIGHAYRLKDFQIEGPDWMTTNRYDVEAIPPVGSPRETYPEMLQQLLAERFGLAVRRSQKEQRVYVLQAGTAPPKLRRAGTEERRSMIMSVVAGQIRLTATAATVEDLADYLMTNVRKLDSPVLNRTGIEGVFDFTLEWVPEKPLTLNGNVAGGENAAGVSIYTAVEQQLGLKLKAEKAPVESLVVERAEKTPAPN
jgi:uncharacterized protein (TIGR03435 family)